MHLDLSQRQMSYKKKIVCLANSRKYPSGFCVAGMEVGSGTDAGSWIRPVSARETEEISEEERRYEDGTEPELLDIISITLSKSSPDAHQQENHLIDDNYYWEKKGTVSWEELQKAVENPKGPLWYNGPSSTHGTNDEVPENRVAEMTRSLYLVRPDKLTILVKLESRGSYGPPRRRVRATFDLCGHSYCFAVTDPHIERKYLAGPNGEFKLKDALLCVSLAKPFNGYAYKLVAAVITPERAGAGKKK